MPTNITLSTASLIRSLTYIEENANIILSDAKARSRVRPIYEVIDVNEFWKSYNALIPSLRNYAAQANVEMISRYTRLFIQHRDTMETYQDSRHGIFDIFSSRDHFRHFPDKEEYIRILQDIYNNVINLTYQVKINAELGR
jgi:hypothetical protein